MEQTTQHSFSIQQRDVSHGLEAVLLGGDLSKMTPDDRIDYYRRVCQSLNLNPLTKPFDFITLNGKLTLYARKDCTDQLRRNNKISVTITGRDMQNDLMVVTAKATTPDGREDESIGALPIGKLSGEALANALMKCETKAKRRVTLSICGLGMTDESEVESIPNVHHGHVDTSTGEIHEVQLLQPHLDLSVFGRCNMTAKFIESRYGNGYLIENYAYMENDFWKQFIQTKADREANGVDETKGSWRKGNAPGEFVPFFPPKAMPSLIAELQVLDASMNDKTDREQIQDALFVDESIENPFEDK